MRFPRRHHIIVWPILLQHPPHRLDVIARESPVALRAQVAEIESALRAGDDAPHRPRNLAGDKILAASWGFVIEEDSVGDEQAIRLSMIHCEPVRCDLADGVRAARV